MRRQAVLPAPIPGTGELVQPVDEVDCSVPAPHKVPAQPVVRDLEGGGKAIDLEGRFDKRQVKPASPNRLAVIDQKTGELITDRPLDAMAAARHDRSLARVRILMKRESGRDSTTILDPQALPGDGLKVDLKGHF